MKKRGAIPDNPDLDSYVVKVMSDRQEILVVARNPLKSYN